MDLVPWAGDIFMQLKLKKRPSKPWWKINTLSWDSYEKYFSTLNPTDWKDHDMYRILRSENRRYFASIDDLQKSYRQIARRFHPDKKPGSDKNYPSIIKAAEVLLNASTRKAFDSVDPALQDTVPDNENEIKERMEKYSFDRNVFFDIFRPIFERNMHWSVIQPVPHIGDWYTSDNKIDEFYSFWLNFDSWREFSYLDKEDKTQCQDRYERKMIEKTNRQERQKLKNEELKRISKLIEMAQGLDPRIKLRRERERLEKLQKQEERKRARLLEEKAAAENQKLEKQNQIEILRKQKEEQAELHKLVVELSHHQSQFRQIALRVLKGKDKQVDHYLKMPTCTTREEKVQASTKTIEFLSQLNSKLEQLDESEMIKELSALIITNTENKTVKGSLIWSTEELELLVKCVRLYPPGTINRWSVIHQYLLEHGVDKTKSEKDVMEKARRLKEGERFQGNKFEAKTTKVANGSIARPWTMEEQKLLEQGLRKYPASDVNRWDSISESITNRSKAECLQRFQHIVAMLKNKKTNK